MTSYKDLPIYGPPSGRHVLVSELVDILNSRSILLQQQGMDQSVGCEAINLIRGAHSEIQSILQRLTNEHS